MYLRCDGDLTVTAEGTPSCTAWVPVSDLANSGQLTQADYYQLAPLVVWSFMAVFFVRMVKRAMNLY